MGTYQILWYMYIHTIRYHDIGVAAITKVVFNRLFGSFQQFSSESAHLFDTSLPIPVSKTQHFQQYYSYQHAP